METKPLTTDEKLDLINKRLKHIEINSYVHIAIVIIGFFGAVTLIDLIKKIKK